MNMNKKQLHTLWSIGITICVLISAIALFCSACSKIDNPRPDKNDSFTVEPETISHQEQTVPSESNNENVQEEPIQITTPPVSAVSVCLEETPDAGRDYLDKFTFLGDSTTYGIGVYYGYGYTELCPPSQVWTPASGTLTLSYYNIATIVYPETGEELTIIDAVTRSKPEILMITLGVNGIAFMDEEWFIRDYTSLVNSIQSVSPNTKIILNSIYPVAASYKYQSDINNDKIRTANIWIKRIAESTNCRFLNTYECLVGSDGYLPESMQNGDGLHLTGEAFTSVMKYIRTHSYY